MKELLSTSPRQLSRRDYITQPGVDRWNRTTPGGESQIEIGPGL